MRRAPNSSLPYCSEKERMQLLFRTLRDGTQVVMVRYTAIQKNVLRIVQDGTQTRVTSRPQAVCIQYKLRNNDPRASTSKLLSGDELWIRAQRGSSLAMSKSVKMIMLKQQLY